MSSREPMWYCHECHAEMRPLMVPDPHCASCNGTFVERIENESDDPREFQEAGPAFEDGPALPGFDQFLLNLGQMFNPAARPRSPTNPTDDSHPPTSEGRTTTTNGGSGFRVEINRTTPGRGTRTFILGGPPTLGRIVSADEGPSIAGPLMAQYLLSMLAQRAQRDGRDNPLGNLGFNLMSDMPDNGRWGDYVFNQEALDQIITQIMENSDSGRPVPATQEIMDKLDRQVLEEGSPLLQKDCAVCKEQFALAGAGKEDDEPDQVVVTLPCKHPFHESCITPWLTSSGTCPVCRYQLVPQPEHHSPGPAGRSSRPGSPSNPPPPPGGGNATGSGVGGVLSALFGAMNQASQSNSSGNSSGSNYNSSGSPPPTESQSRDRDVHDDLPGGWVD